MALGLERSRIMLPRVQAFEQSNSGRGSCEGLDDRLVRQRRIVSARLLTTTYGEKPGLEPRD